MIIGVIGFVEVREDWQEGTKRESGPNDARRVGPLVLFFHFMLFFFTNL